MTSFGIFKFMVTYSLTEFLSVIILYSIDSNLTDLEFLFIDICLIVNFAFFFGKTQAYEGKLVKTPPMTSLLSFTPLFSLIVHMFTMTIFQTIAFYSVEQFSWFKPFVHTTATAYSCYENYSVFCVSLFQYITTAVIFSRGKPYRKAIWTNKMFILSIFILVSICVYITIYPADWVVNTLQLMVPPEYDWPVLILFLGFVNFVVCMLIETVLIEWAIERKLKPIMYRPEKSKKYYLRVEHDLKKSPGWPSIDKELPTLPMTPSVENIIKTCSEDDETFNETETRRGIENLAFVDDEKVVVGTVNETTKF